MSLPVLILIVGFTYIVLMGGLSLLRREGFSAQFAIEAITLTGLASGLVALAGFYVHPILFLLALYLITMRVRLLVDIGTTFAKSGRFSQADNVYQLATRLWPDETGKMVILVNQGTALVQQGRLDEAIAAFRSVLERSNQGYLSVKYESAAHYNLGVAYLRKNLEASAAVEFNAVLDTWPASEYARQAASALEQRSRKNLSTPGQEKQ